MARLPIPGEDIGTWGDILNEFLEVAHNQDGSLRNINLEQISNLAANSPSDGDTLVYEEATSTWVTGSSAPSVPPGAIMSFIMNAEPDGWLKCNGQAVSRTQYADLFAIIGTEYGVGDGSTTFNLPDLRGEFLRAWDDGRGVDTGRDLGSAQADQNKEHQHDSGSLTAASDGAHTHTQNYLNQVRMIANNGSSPTITVPTVGETAGLRVKDGSNPRFSQGGIHDDATMYFRNGTMSTTSNGSHTHSISGNTADSGGTEARPRNIALLYCIKY